MESVIACQREIGQPTTRGNSIETNKDHLIKSRTIKINPVSHNSPVYYKHPSEDHDAVKSQTSGRVEEFWSDQMEEGGREGEKEEQPEPAPGLGAGDSGRNMRGPPHHIKGELQGPGPVSAPNGFPDPD